MSQKLVVGNWKLNGSLVANETLLRAIVPVDGVEVAVCVPFPYLAQVAAWSRGKTGGKTGGGIALGAQTVSEHGAGAYTGEVGAAMLADFGCRYVIVGHSERRSLFGEDDALVGRKAAAALAAGLTPIVCTGESLGERDGGQAMAVIGRQLGAVLDVMGGEGFRGAVIAYEPVWAIGSGRAASVAEVEEVHGCIRAWCDAQGVAGQGMRILYGGSVKAGNARALFALPGVDGGLVGGASLVAADFMAICRAASGGD
ncbi:MAG: triose-phosphate isomerase [Azoarcus sp.]|jgi:triosephosphate isomerase|nr:triose-phosphate isomerase [Azoarcus sp.]